MRIVKFLYLLFIVSCIVCSYFFVDANFPLPSNSIARSFVQISPLAKTFIYTSLIAISFVFYGIFLYSLRRKKISSREAWVLVFFTALLVLSYPAFSFDIFNYIATAKVSFLYRENPYIVMPIELSYEPLLVFMHAANKTALYGPVWILLTGIPHFAGFNNLFATVLTFKVFVLIFYLGLSYLLWLLSKRNLFTLVFFALNPLVIFETLISGHNDVVMMFFALLSFYLLKKKLFILASVSLLCSILIKFATLFLLPVFLWTLVNSIRNKAIVWQRVWYFSFISLFVVFLLSPIREEMYSWYFIWPLTFLALIENSVLLKVASVGLSFGLLLRFIPYLYLRTYADPTPILKKIVTVSPVIISLLVYQVYKRLNK